MDSAPSSRSLPWARIAIIAGLIALSMIAIVEGLRLRRAEFDRTHSVRFSNDVANGFRWGQIGNSVGLFRVYDQINSSRFPLFLNELDYTPLRLAIVTGWAKWVQARYPRVASWQNDYDFTWPMMTLNNLAELAASVLAFALVRWWIIRFDDAQRAIDAPPRRFRGVVRGMIAALLLWFNPAVIWDAHAFPQWDVWIAPFFLAAVFLGCLDWWFTAGCCIAVGAFLKGQILLVAPILLVWQLVRLRWDPILRLIGGFVLAAAVIAFPWMRPEPGEIGWLVLTFLSLAMAAPIVLKWRIDRMWMIGLLVIAILLAWPWFSHAVFKWRYVPSLLVALAAAWRFAPPRLAPHVYGLIVGLMISLLIPLFNVSTTWYSQGFEFGTEKQMRLAADETINLPAVLRDNYQWHDNQPQVPIELLWIGTTISFRALMLLAYAACLIVCGIGAALHDRRNDPRFLVAMVAPWLCWFVLLTQLNNRYLVWAAGFSALFTGVDLGMTLLGLVVTAIGWIGIAQIMYLRSSGGDPETRRLLGSLHPHLAWPLMLAAAVYLWIAVSPRRRGRPS